MAEGAMASGEAVRAGDQSDGEGWCELSIEKAIGFLIFSP